MLRVLQGSIIAFSIIGLSAGCTNTVGSTNPQPELGAAPEELLANASAVPNNNDSTWVRLAREVPGGFAGIYLKHGALVLALTQPEKKLDAIAALTARHLELPPRVDLRDAIVERVRWNFAQLYDWSRYVFPRVHMKGLVMADLDELHNSVTIGILQQDTASVNADLKKLSLPSGLVRVEAYASPVCVNDTVSAVRVWAKDLKTGQSVTPGARLTIRSTGFTKTSVGPANLPQAPLEAAVLKAGVFDLLVQQTGYRDWEQKNVAVRFDDCHPIIVELTALLTRQ